MLCAQLLTRDRSPHSSTCDRPRPGALSAFRPLVLSSLFCAFARVGSFWAEEAEATMIPHVLVLREEVLMNIQDVSFSDQVSRRTVKRCACFEEVTVFLQDGNSPLISPNSFNGSADGHRCGCGCGCGCGLDRSILVCQRQNGFRFRG